MPAELLQALHYLQRAVSSGKYGTEVGDQSLWGSQHGLPDWRPPLLLCSTKHMLDNLHQV